MSLLGVNVLLAATASVAAIRIPNLLSLLQSHGACVKLLATPSALHFLEKERQLSQPALSDDHEWHTWQQLGDPVLHISLRDWAHVLLIAPLSANSLAKLANGMADNLVLCVARAWQFDKKPLLVAPAMNVAMWEHPITEIHLEKLRAFGVKIAMPICKRLACGDVGQGAMCELPQLVTFLLENLHHLHSPPTSAS